MLETVGAVRATPLTETVALEMAAGRVLGEPIPADRDYPALARSVRDGYAVRARDLPGEFTVIGEVRAGESFPRRGGERQAVEIMTGAPVPRGADAVVMLEHVARDGPRLTAGQPAAPGQFINPQGSKRAPARSCSIPAGVWITPASPCWPRPADKTCWFTPRRASLSSPPEMRSCP